MKAVLLFQVSLVLCVLSQPQLIYIDQSTQIPLDEQNGTLTNPFASLQSAFQASAGLTADLVFVGQSYIVDTNITFESENWAETVMTVRAEAEDFTLSFADEGQIICNNYPQDLLTPAIKNVVINFADLTIETQSQLPLFVGTCYFHFDNIFIEELRSTLMVLGTEGSASLKNFTINNIILQEDQNLIDQDSRERIEADYLTLDNVYMRNTVVKSNGQVYAMIRSFLQYKLVQVTNSVFEGIGFSIKGEELGAGNNKTNIIVQNITMKNAENFFFIESYGNLSLQDSSFINASNRAVHLFLADENLSPVMATFQNCLFQDNAVKYAGGALTFQSSKETNYNLYVTTLLSECRFINNKASFSGGALAFLFFKNADVTVVDSQFSGNSAAEAGGAIYVDKGLKTMSMVIQNNIFTSNSAFTGGVFSFEFLDGAQITLKNNTYTNNQAKLEGGVGYVTESLVTLTDTNSVASGNEAGFQAGAWSLESESTITFENISFKDTSAFLRGGCITNSGAFLTLNQITFENCVLSAISSSGGALFIGEDAIVKVSNARFSNNRAEFGAAITIQSQKEASQILENVTLVSDLGKLSEGGPTIKSQIRSGPGTLALESLVASNIQTPLLSQEDGTVNLKSIQIANINCHAEDDSLNFCVFGIKNSGNSDPILVVEDLRIENLNSSVPFAISQRASASLTTVVIDQMNLANDVPVWDITDTVFKVNNMELLDLDNNFVRAVNSVMDVVDSNFDYQERRPEADTTSSNKYDLVPKA